jgi:glutathione peroxidase
VFGRQEPGSADDIRALCRDRYGVGFPVFDKVEVNGPGRHPLYASLTRVPDADGVAGDISWNFEKFLVSPGGPAAPAPGGAGVTGAGRRDRGRPAGPPLRPVAKVGVPAKYRSEAENFVG